MKRIIRFGFLGMLVSGLVLADHLNKPVTVRPGGGLVIRPLDHGPIILPVDTRIIHCSSDQYRYRECRTGGRIVNVELVRRYSKAACVEGRSFGVRGGVLFVDRGCRADFRVMVVRGTGDHFHDVITLETGDGLVEIDQDELADLLEDEGL